MVGWRRKNLSETIQIKKNKSAAYLIRAHQRKIEAVVLKGRSSKKGESFRF